MKFHHVALSVANVDRTVEFYGHFGLTTKLDMTTDDGLRIMQLWDDQYRIELFWRVDMQSTTISDETAGGLGTTGIKHIAFWSDDLDADLDRLSEVGIEPGAPVTQARSMPNTRLTFFRDPDGHWVELMGK